MSVESMNTKRYLSALENAATHLTPPESEVQSDRAAVGRPRPEGAEHLPPPLPPRIDKIDLTSGQCNVYNPICLSR